MVNVYVLIFALGYVGAFFSVFSKEKISIFAILSPLFLVVLFSLSGFRSQSVGYDNVDHLLFFERFAHGGFSVFDFKEPGYAVLSFLVSFFGGYNIFISVYAFLSLLLLYLSLRCFSITPIVSLYLYYALYFFGNNMGKIRQSMSVLFVMVALAFLHKNKIRLFILMVLGAASFHASALFFFVFLALRRVRLTKKRMFILLVFAIAFGRSGIIDFAYRNIVAQSDYLRTIGVLGLNRLARYAESSHTVRETSGAFGYLYTLLHAFLMAFYFDKLKKMHEGKGFLIAQVCFWGYFIFFLLFDLALINSRLTMFFLVNFIFLVPLLFKCVSNVYLRAIFVLFVLLGVLLRGWVGFYAYYDAFVPFEFYWQ